MMLKKSFLDRLIHLKSFWLIPIVLMFFISAVVSLAQLRQSILILDERYGTSVWTLFQLRGELRRFHDSLSIFRGDPSTLDALHENYDILWSRFPVVLEGVDAEHITKIEGAIEQLEENFIFIQSLEKGVFEILPQNPEYSVEIQQALLPHLKAIEKLSIDNYHHNNDFYNRGDQRVSELQQQLIWLMFGLIVAGSLLLVMIFRENRINRYMAEHDSLTEMPNRAYLKLKLLESCEKGIPFALHLLDLNGFKDVNDTLGHHTGDFLLKALSKRLHEKIDIPFNCLTCRLGGDEFAILQPGLKGLDAINQVAETIVQALEKPFTVDNHICHIGVSIGSTIYPEHGREASKLLTRADIAMYKAKEYSPVSRHVLFDYEMDSEINRRQQIQRDLREALKNSRLYLVYQPIISLNSDKPSYFEALLRWDHGIYGAVPPLEIVAIAEQYSLAVELGSWVIDETCRQIAEWKDSGMQIRPVSVNISPSMYRLDLATLIENSQRKYAIESGLIRIEVTEDTALHIINDAEDTFSKCRDSGISLALDDFGTGLSSLSYLQKLPVQTLKIDRSFTKKMLTDPVSCSLVKSMIDIGHDLGMEVVAEGVEVEDMAKMLMKFNCDYGQGYHFSKPVKPEEILKNADYSIS